MISHKLETLKRTYRTSKTPHWLKSGGFNSVMERLSEKPKSDFNFGLVFKLSAALSIVLIITTALVSRTSKPGENLYQVKVLSDKVYSQITGDWETPIEKRAEEVIEQSDTPNGSFEEAKKQYEEAIEEAKDKRQDDQESRKEELRKKLEEQERRFQDLQQGKLNKQRLQELEEFTKRKRAEVKGEKNKIEKSDNEKSDSRKDDKED